MGVWGGRAVSETHGQPGAFTRLERLIEPFDKRIVAINIYQIRGDEQVELKRAQERNKTLQMGKGKPLWLIF